MKSEKENSFPLTNVSWIVPVGFFTLLHGPSDGRGSRRRSSSRIREKGPFSRPERGEPIPTNILAKTAENHRKNRRNSRPKHRSESPRH